MALERAAFRTCSPPATNVVIEPSAKHASSRHWWAQPCPAERSSSCERKRVPLTSEGWCCEHPRQNRLVCPVVSPGGGEWEIIWPTGSWRWVYPEHEAFQFRGTKAALTPLGLALARLRCHVHRTTISKRGSCFLEHCLHSSTLWTQGSREAFRSAAGLS